MSTQNMTPSPKVGGGNSTLSWIFSLIAIVLFLSFGFQKIKTWKDEKRVKKEIETNRKSDGNYPPNKTVSYQLEFGEKVFVEIPEEEYSDYSILDTKKGDFFYFQENENSDSILIGGGIQIPKKYGVYEFYLFPYEKEIKVKIRLKN